MFQEGGDLRRDRNLGVSIPARLGGEIDETSHYQPVDLAG